SRARTRPLPAGRPIGRQAAGSQLSSSETSTGRRQECPILKTVASGFEYFLSGSSGGRGGVSRPAGYSNGNRIDLWSQTDTRANLFVAVITLTGFPESAPPNARISRREALLDDFI